MLNLSTELHYTNWQIKGPIVHRQDAVEFHASVGLMLLLVIFLRVVYYNIKRSELPRLPAKSKQHQTFIRVVHTGLYTSLIAIVLTGLGLANNYEIPLSIYGFKIEPIKQDFLDVFPTLLEIHLALQNLFWTLVAVHFVGFIMSKR